MKRFTMIVALLLMVAMPMMAERVSPETARKVATTFLNNNGAKAAQLTDLSKVAGFQNLYIFTAEQGFVVMAADDCVQPILGYSLTGEFVAEGMPENIRGWLQGYNDEIQSAVDSKMKASNETTKIWKELVEGNAKAGKTTSVVNALVQTQWDQNGYSYNGTMIELYNNLCPYDYTAGERTATGCVATAMAQILKYWEYPSHGVGSYSYTPETHPEYGVQSANFGVTTYAWSDMPNQLTSSSTNTQINAVATLMYHCGVSVRMDYDIPANGGSSASTAQVVNALKNYFGYQQSTYKSKEYYENTWIPMLKTELDNGRPLQYRGSGTGGHSFVCDGYDNRDYFHFNWGWSGNNDGFYALNDLVPGSGGAGGSNYSFINDQGAIFGIQPVFNNPYAPSNLQATLVQSTGVRNVSLSWSAATGASSYKVYRNNMIMATVSSGTLAYTDVHIPYGTNTYYIRSVDNDGELSQPSNSQAITVTFDTPANLTAQLDDDAVSLTWDGSAQAVSYNVYCNEIIIANVSETSYTHSHVPYGELIYYVRGMDDLDDLSDDSNTATVSHDYYGPIVNDLSATLSGNNIALSWTPLVSESATLKYATASGTYSYGGYGIRDTYWGVRFPSSMLSDYAGMALTAVSNYIRTAGFYSVYAYQCTTKTPSGDPILALENQNLASGTQTLSFSPIYLDPTKDLWVVFKTTDIEMPWCFKSVASADGCYYSPDGVSWSKKSNCSWFISADITDGTFTYNIDRNGQRIASDLTSAGYTDANRNNAASHYTVTTNYYGGESAASNGVGYTLGQGSISTLELGANDQMTVTENSQLNISGTLSNDNAEHLILENGAQLIHNSDGVKATVKKGIAPHTQDGGWYLLASPIVESITPTVDNGFLANNYDFYIFDQSEDLEWRNIEAGAFNIIDNKTGYLYANSSDPTLSFEGTLVANTTATTLAYDNNAEFKGFNLIGNPYPCNAYVDRSFYVMNEDGSDFTMGSNPIPPCSAILVQAQGSGESVSFSKTATKNEPCIAISVTEANMRSNVVIDKAKINFDPNNSLEKYNLREDNSQLYIPQNGQRFAVASANGENVMPLNFKANQNGTYTLWFETEKLELNYLHLIDNMTGTDVDLLESASYNFEAKTTDNASRFKLVFSICENADNGNDSFVFASNGQLHLLNKGEAQLQIVDIMGRILSTETIHGSCSKALNLSDGIYIVRIIQGSETKTQKVVVR